MGPLYDACRCQRRFPFSSSLFFLTLCILSLALTPPLESFLRMPISQMVFQNNLFAMDVYKKLGARSSNFVFSPYALTTGLAILYLGAKGTTEAELVRVGNFKLAAGFQAESCKALQEMIGSNRGYRSGVSLWLQKGVPIEESFLDRAQKYFPNLFQQADFSLRMDSSRAEINQFVSVKTGKAIPNFLSISDLNRVKMQLILASFFEGVFKASFEPKRTSTQSFFQTSTRSRQVAMMSLDAELPYFENDEYQLVELPFQSQGAQQEGSISLILLAPKEVEGLKEIEKKMGFESLSGAITSLHKKNVSLDVPRFKLSPIVDMKPIFEMIGLKTAFNIEADFSGISFDKPLYLGKIIDKNPFRLFEKGVNISEGAEVAIATTTSEEEETVKVVVNRPFLFFIYDNYSGQILVLGRCQEP